MVREGGSAYVRLPVKVSKMQPFFPTPWPQRRTVHGGSNRVFTVKVPELGPPEAGTAQ